MTMATVLTKLKIKDGAAIVILGAPDHVGDQFSDFQHIQSLSELIQPVTYLFTFVDDLSSFKEIVDQVAKEEVLNEDCYLFVIYPKLQNKLGLSGIHRDDIFPTLKVDEGTGLVANLPFKFNRMVAYDDNYTLVGLKRVNPKKVMKQKQTKPEINGDQIIEDLATSLSDLNQEAAVFFKTLTPGYQKSWSQHVFSAKQQATQIKRLEQTADLLQQGFKSLNHYQQAKKK